MSLSPGMIFLATFLFPGLSGAGEKAPVEITVNMTKEMVSLEDVNSGAKKFTIQYRNRSKTPQVIHPLVELKIVDSRGQVVKPNRHLGRFGWRLTKCALGGKVFRTLKPGEVFLRLIRRETGFRRLACFQRAPHVGIVLADHDEPYNPGKDRNQHRFLHIIALQLRSSSLLKRSSPRRF